MPCLENVISDVQSQMFPNRQFTFEVNRIENEPHRWIVYIRSYRNEHAILEFLIDEDPNDPDDTDVAASVLQYGNIPRRIVGLVMDSIIERL
jgi:hypothetical protein